MVPTNHLVTFTLTAFALIAVPGPSVLFVISRALVIGRTGALITVLGNALGVYVQVVAVAFGVGAIVERSIAVFTIIKLAGAGYLIYLGVQALRHRRALSAVFDNRPAPQSRLRVLREGFTVGLANPKSVVFFAAVLPQFVDRPAGHVPVQLLILGAIFFLVALLSDSLWAVVAGSARNWFARSPGRLATLGGTGGLLMVGIGARLAFSGRND
ncbi:threonine/homoserine/homoserine lactone efflux protein [Jatrophihabitans sp. GAS493]|uniref:LysE family translocator n=1 Tax=Jatrophihabitans sp. GAS493 TaxID=1907575 RepID=UPI000BB87FB2|nr:LysE family translocator [Jatrophihabitans sp. GAS493]SOD71490.1 threonine/homoserine/homoserine lactone efflux protein [Jatrophihabitans sp. GAS493]